MLTSPCLTPDASTTSARARAYRSLKLPAVTHTIDRGYVKLYHNSTLHKHSRNSRLPDLARWPGISWVAHYRASIAIQMC